MIETRQQLDHLTGFRGIAAYLVLIGHSFLSSFIFASVSLRPIFANLTYLGMSIFFVLSGFIITYNYYDRFAALPWRQAAHGFMVARFARLYPLYFVCMLCDPNHIRPFIQNTTLIEKISYLTLTQSWWNKYSLSFLGAWSISTEFFFYLCFALWMLFPKAPQQSETYVLRITVVSLIGAFLILAGLFTNQNHIAMFLTPMLGGHVWDWFAYISPCVRMGEFIAGACAARMFMVARHKEYSTSEQRRAGVFCFFSVMAIIIIFAAKIGAISVPRVSGFFSLWNPPFSLWYGPLLAYIFYACSKYPHSLSRLCSTRFMLIGGEISYSLYLLQFSIFEHVFQYQIADYDSFWAYESSFMKALLYIILTTVAAKFSYHLIEMPSRRFLRKWLSNSTVPA